MDTEKIDFVPPDNCAETWRDLLRFILGPDAPHGLRLQDEAKLMQDLADETGVWHRVIYLSYQDDAKPGLRAECTLGIMIEPLQDQWFGAVVDPDGTLWRQMQIMTGVNWPSFGNSSPDEALIRLNLMVNVAKFAESLEEKFNHTLYVKIATKAEREETHQRNEVEKLNDTVRNAVLDCWERKHMRIGSEKVLAIERFKNLPNGRYTVELDKKEFQLEIRYTGTAFLTRTR